MALARGLRFDANLVSFDFQPSIGFSARRIDKLGMDIRSFREPLTRAIKQVMIPSFHANFDAEGRPPWEPLRQSTIEKRGSAHPILNRSGKLRRRITQLSRWDIKTETAAIKSLPSDVFYGYYHQSGIEGETISELTDIRSASGVGFEMREAQFGGVAQRRFVMFQDDDQDEILRVFGDWLDERALLAGLNLRGG
jgi:phage gpG-like protein